MSSDALSQHLRACEERLLDPAVRRDRDRVAAMLTDDFEEFGSSGRVWSRAAILDLLATEDYAPPAIEDFTCHMLSACIALVTYKTVRAGDAGSRAVTLRSSIWIKEAGVWRVRFHQGTRMP